MATLTRTMTYAELVAAITAGTLNKGESITISDYHTVHIIPNTEDINTGDIEPLLVTAISNNELKPEAYSVAFPDDVIYYNPINDQTMVPGCTKGYIYRRIDTKQNNDFPFDFRQVKFRRWQIDVPNWDSATEYSKMSVVKRPTGTAAQQLEIYISLVDSNTNNVVTDAAYWYRFEFDNLTYISPTQTSWDRSNEYTFVIPCSALYQDCYFFADGDYTTCYSNKLESPNNGIITNSNTVVFGANFNSNSIGANFNSNSIGAGFSSNSIGVYFYSNTIGVSFYSNSIGANFNSNSIGAGFSSNSIGASFTYNSIGANFNYNSIGAGFSSNSIGVYFYSNTIGVSFTYNSIGVYFYSNSIGADFSSNSIGADFSSNSIGAYFSYNSIGANFNSNSIGAGFTYNSIGDDFSSNSIGASSSNNTIGANFSYNSIGDSFYSNSIGAYFSYNSIGANFNSNSIGAGFSYNNSSDNVNNIDFMSVSELYSKTYAHQIFGREDGGCVIIWYDDAGDQQKAVI